VAPPTVLISGAGIAGPSLALWLTNNGYRVTVVEIASGIRPGGQTVDLRGAGADVVERIGLMPQMRTHALEQHGVAGVKSDGSRRAEMPVTAATSMNSATYLSTASRARGGNAMPC
jgi:2-polyprenyl-6-methoxyphenol hydroxylase-like FAD-dependent oxidoreductase